MSRLISVGDRLLRTSLPKSRLQQRLQGAMLTVNGVPVQGLLPTTVREMIQGAENSEVVLTLETAKFSDRK